MPVYNCPCKTYTTKYVGSCKQITNLALHIIVVRECNGYYMP